MGYFGYFIIAFGLVIGYGYYFYRRSQAQKAGGDEAIYRARLKKLFQLPDGEKAWRPQGTPSLYRS